jgi:hypothetical protein
VRQDQKRITSASGVTRGKRRDAFERRPFLTCPLHGAHRTEVHLCERFVTFRRDLSQCAALQNGEVLHVLRISHREYWPIWS